MNHSGFIFDNLSIEKEKIFDFARLSNKFLICAFYNNRIIGNLACIGMPQEFQKNNAQIGMIIQKEFCGIGLGKEILKCAISSAKEIGFHRLELNVRTFNIAGIALYESIGFRKIGLLQQSAFIDGEYFDEYMYELVL